MLSYNVGQPPVQGVPKASRQWLEYIFAMLTIHSMEIRNPRNVQLGAPVPIKVVPIIAHHPADDSDGRFLVNPCFVKIRLQHCLPLCFRRSGAGDDLG